jgi:tetratricopeptide (TPR) repeat protein
MSSVATTLAAAIQRHQAGQLHEAEVLYRQVLAAEPRHPQALHLLGVIAYQVGMHEPAIEHILAALQIHGPDAEMLSNLGAAYVALGRIKEAEACYRQALQLRPTYAEAHYNLGNVFMKQGHLAAAIVCYQRTLQFQPNRPSALVNLGNAWQAQGKLLDAVACFEQVVRSQPGFVEAHINLGNAYHALARVPDAIACYRTALRLRPEFAEGHHGLGNALQSQGHIAQAMDCYRQALRLMPDHADAHFGLGLALLRQGQWEQGWPEYHWRWRTRDFTVPPFPQPAWDGSDLTGRTIVIYAEQGLGDTIQFARYAPLIKERGGRVLLRCQVPLVRLLADLSGIAGIVPRDQPLPPCDCHASLLNLPMLFHTTPATVPAQVPYLTADVARRARWRAWLDEKPGRKIGVCWQGNPKHKEDAKRSLKIASLKPWAQVAGVRLVSLQVGDGDDRQAEEAKSSAMLDPGLVADQQGETFMELAALMRELDLVISVDTALVHLAGALGVPTWVVLAYVPDWRWLMEREDTPWYPTLKLFRQSQLGDWETVITRIAKELRASFATNCGHQQ